MSNDVILGIDLGTIDSCAAIYRNNGVETVPDIDGNKIIPSMVCYKGENDIFLYGQTARDNSLEFAETTMFESKRFIGNQYKFKSVQKDIEHLPVKIIEDKKTGKPKYQIKLKAGIKEYFPEEVSSMILKYIKKYCDVFKGNNSKIKKTIITVPAHFNKWQREATVEAGKNAGLYNIELLNEATAAAIAYVDKFKEANKEMKILIFDIGGGTFDVSILSVLNNKYKVLSSCGDSHLGGEDFNQKLLDYIKTKVQNDDNFKDTDFTKAKILKKFRKEVEKKKKELSKLDESSFYVEALKGDNDFKMTIKRETFEELCMPLWNKMFDIVEEALKIANIQKEDLDNVIFVGGPTRTPKIEEMATDFFGDVEILKNVNVEEVVAQGAALSGNLNLDIEDTISKSIGVETANFQFSEIIPKGTNLPTTGNMKVFSKKYTLKGLKKKQKIKILEGKDYIGDFILTLDEDEKEIEIKMTIDRNLILHVSAVVNGKKKENKNIEMKTIIE